MLEAVERVEQAKTEMREASSMVVVPGLFMGDEWENHRGRETRKEEKRTGGWE
jgi:hypothetical protein